VTVTVLFCYGSAYLVDGARGVMFSGGMSIYVYAPGQRHFQVACCWLVVDFPRLFTSEHVRFLLFSFWFCVVY